MFIIRTVGQPIVNIYTGETVLEERLCRPECGIKEYFSFRDPEILIRRELHAVLQCIEDSRGIPFNVNVTLYTLPYLCRLPIVWEGGIELVEWGISPVLSLDQLRYLIRAIQYKGMCVWADDVTRATLEMWSKAGVNGLKIEINDLENDLVFCEKALTSKLPLIAEKIETQAQHELAKSLGIIFGQGYYYGYPGENDEPGEHEERFVIAERGVRSAYGNREEHFRDVR